MEGMEGAWALSAQLGRSALAFGANPRDTAELWSLPFPRSPEPESGTLGPSQGRSAGDRTETSGHTAHAPFPSAGRSCLQYALSTRAVQSHLGLCHILWEVLRHSVMLDSWQPVDCSPPGSSVHGILQGRMLEGVAIPFLQGISPILGWKPPPRHLLHWQVDSL